MAVFMPLCMLLSATLCFFQGEALTISTRFMNGKLVFTWTNTSTNNNHVQITEVCSATHWISVENDQYAVDDVLPYKYVRIRVREFNTSIPADGYVDYEKTYNVTAVKSKEGDSMNISWTAEFFPRSGNYFIFHENNGSLSKIINIANAYPLSTGKYVYHTRPFNSINILIEVKNITVGDAGYYIGSPTENNAWSGERGAVLIVSGKPLKPKITGDLNVKVGEYASLKCESRSTSGPFYYKKFPPLSYSWFVNNTKLDREDRETYRFIVTKDVKYNRYNCQAKETLESERSKNIRMNPLYGPGSITIIPQPTDGGIYVHEGETFGPYTCSADCYPPCTLQWKYKSPTGELRDATSIGISSTLLPQQTANRAKMALIRCLVNGTDGRSVSNIKLNIQYGPGSITIIPQPTDRGLDVPEGETFGPYTCSADCYPPCTLQWQFKSPLGEFRNASSIGLSSTLLPQQTANRANMALIRCLVNGTEGRSVSNIKLNIQYGPESITIIPRPPDEGLDVHEGETFGPYNCSAVCYPPCTLQWKYKSPTGELRNATTIGISSIYLPQQTANKANMALIRCLVNGTEGRSVSNIKLNIQYLLDPRVYINGKPKNASTINETTPVLLSCFVDGNPIPEVTLRILTGSQILIQSGHHWLNYTLIRMAQCSDTGTFECVGKSTEFGRRNQSFSINVLCDPRLDEFTLVKNIYGSRSGPDVKVVVSLPVVANPLSSTSGFAWSGPSSESISIKVSQRDKVIYKHWINSTIPVPDRRSFGSYSLMYKEKVIADITIKAEDKPQPPLNFSWYSYASGYINLTWISDFNGGLEQIFILSSKEGPDWRVVNNVTDPGEGNIGYYDLGPLTSGLQYWYRLESCNRISCSSSPAEVNVTVQGVSIDSREPLAKEIWIVVGVVAGLSVFLLMNFIVYKFALHRGIRLGLMVQPPQPAHLRTMDFLNLDNMEEGTENTEQTRSMTDLPTFRGHTENQYAELKPHQSKFYTSLKRKSL